MKLETVEVWVNVTVGRTLAWAIYATWLAGCWLATWLRTGGKICHRWYSRSVAGRDQTAACKREEAPCELGTG